jgi:tyrosinase
MRSENEDGSAVAIPIFSPRKKKRTNWGNSKMPTIKMAMSDFTSFASNLNGVHGGVHIWVGGAMSSVATAPADPIFWMHHANLDRLWYSEPGNAGKNASLTGAAAVMDPWTYTEPDTRDITALGYTYV